MDQEQLDLIPHARHEGQDFCGLGRRERLGSIRLGDVLEHEPKQAHPILFAQHWRLVAGTDRDRRPWAIGPEELGVPG